MRLSSRVIRVRKGSRVTSMSLPPETDHEEELTAFRGLLIAASASALLWSLGLAVAWLLLARN